MTSIALLAGVLLGAPIVVGWPLARLLGNRSQIELALLLDAWATGLASFSILALALGSTGANLGTLVVSWCAIGLLALAIAFRHHSPIARTANTRLSHLVIIVGLTLVSVAGAGSPWSVGADDAAHLAEIDAIARSGEIFASDTFHLPGEVQAPDPRFGSLHTFYGAAARYLRVPPEQIWLAGRIGATLVIWLGFYRLACALIGSSAALWSTLLAIVLLGGSRFPVQLVAMYPLWVGMAFVWLAATRWLGRLKGQTVPWSDLIWIPALPLVHYFPWLAFWILVGCFFLAFHFKSLPRGIWTHRNALLVLLLGSVVVITPRLLLTAGNSNPIHSDRWNIASVGSGLFVFQPPVVFEAVGLLGILAPILGSILLLWRPRGLSLSKPAWISTWIPLVIPLNPVVVTGLYSVLGFLLFRCVLVSLYPLLYGQILESWIPRRLAWPSIVVAVGLVAYTLMPTPPDARWPRFDSSWVESAREITLRMEPDSILLSDPYTMLGLAAFTPASVAAVPDGRSSPRDPHAFDRLLYSSIAMDTAASERLALGALVKTRATHLVITAWEQWPHGYLYPAGTTDAHELERRFLAWGAKRLMATGRLTILDLRAMQMPTELTPLPSRTSPASSRVELSVQTLPQSVDVGDTLRLHVSASSTGIGPGIEMPKLYVRLDRDPLAGGDRPFGKLLRKLQERREGRRQRQRTDFEVRPAAVLDAQLAATALTVQVPVPIAADLQSGNYRIGLSWSIEGRTHPEHVIDLIRNRDSYSGPDFGSIEVLR